MDVRKGKKRKRKKGRIDTKAYVGHRVHVWAIHTQICVKYRVNRTRKELRIDTRPFTPAAKLKRERQKPLYDCICIELDRP